MNEVKMREIKFRLWNTVRKKIEYSGMVFLGNKIIQDKYNIVMQFTSLKDKNGKEIYEGDILQDDEGNQQIVEFNTFIDGDGYASSGYTFRNLLSFDDTENIEIIGNIYENLELIK